MKKILITLLSVVLAVTCLATVAFADEISVNLDGEKLSFEQPPVIVEERTLVPLRAIFEALGATVNWDGETRTVTSVKGDVTIKLTIGEKSIYKNGEAFEIDVPAQIVGEGYTMVPVRAISESFGLNVDWDDATKTVILVSPEPAVPEVEGAIITLADAENGLGNFEPGYRVDSIDVVADPVNADNNVYFINSSYVGEKVWSYIWLKTEFEAGKTYKVSYDALSGKDATGSYIESARTSACFQFAQSDKDDGIVRDHGLSMVEINPEAWTHVELSYTVPETIIPEKSMKFGIYVDPATDNAMTMYVDNIVVVPADEEPKKEETKPAIPEADDKTANEANDGTKLVADSFTSDSRFNSTGTATPQLVVVNNPKDSSDKVFYLESNVTEKNSWTYFWMDNAGYTAGQKYIVEYDIMISDTDSHGDKAPEKVGVGNNFVYGEQGVPSKDHGYASFSCLVGEWTHVVIVYTIPETLDANARMRYGVYASPKDSHCYSYYIDNFSLTAYNGDMNDGLYDADTLEAAKKMESFNIDSVEGLVYDFAENFEPFNINKAYAPAIVDGHLSLTTTTKEQSDVQFGTKKVEFTADDYNRVAMKIKFDGEGFSSNYMGFYFATESDTKLNQAKYVQGNYATAKKTDDGYYVVVINLDSNEHWKGKITEVRFDPFQNIVGTAMVDKVVLFKE